MRTSAVSCTTFNRLYRPWPLIGNPLCTMRSRVVRFPSPNKRHALYLDVGSELGMGGPGLGTASIVCPDSRELALDGVYLGHLI